MADDAQEKSLTPRQTAAEITRTVILSCLAPLWLAALWRYLAHRDANGIWAVVVWTISLMIILGGGIYLGYRKLRRRWR